MIPNRLILKKRRECAEKGHGKLVRGPGGVRQCSLCGQQFAPGERQDLLHEAGGPLTKEEKEAMDAIRRG